MKLTPEQIEEQRPIFIEAFKKIRPRYVFETPNCFYVRYGLFQLKKTQDYFSGWLGAIESQPEKEIMLPEDDGTISQAAYRLEVEAFLKTQGFKIKVKE